MTSLQQIINSFLHLDKHLADVIQQYGGWTYLILFIIVFCETGLVVTPFLPGDSLLFAAGALAAGGSLNVVGVMALLLVAGVSGDAVNYQIGRILGPKAFRNPNSRIFKKQYLDRTHEFYEKYGGKTIIIARFVPIVRTFAPFVAGVGKMTYWHFATYNVIGAVLWVVGITSAGYFFGGLDFVKKNFSLVILAIIIISILPGVFEVWRARRGRKATAENSGKGAFPVVLPEKNANRD